MTLAGFSDPKKARGVFSLVAETSVILAAGASLYWSGQTASTIQSIQREQTAMRAQLEGVRDNVLKICALAPQLDCEK